MDEDKTRTSADDGVAGSLGHAASVLSPPMGPEERSNKSRTFSLAEMLVDAGILTQEQVATAQETAWRERQTLGRVLVREPSRYCNSIVLRVAR